MERKDLIRFIRRNWKLIAGLLYLISPIDFIPDVLAPFGIGDDALVALITLLSRYRDYKKELKMEQELRKSKIVEGEIVSN